MSGSSSSARNFISMANKYDRVVLLVDMDCFYCQVEEKLDPSLKGKPLAVVQYNAWRGGGIIAVNYAARAKGVTRHMRGDEAKEQCPDIQLIKVPNVREKADLTKYREAGKDVANVLQRFTPLLERASVDEAYLDITDAVNKRLKEMNDGIFVLEPKELVNTYAVGFPSIGEFVTKITSSFISNPVEHNDELYRNFRENDIPAVRQSNIRLLIGASIASEIRNAVKTETSYECSAGIAHNKILAKLACGLNKPNKQTILPIAEITVLFETLPISKIKGLGAKFGEEICERLKVRYLGELLKFTEAELQKKFDEKNGTWLYNICRGIDLEAVTPRFYSKSIGCCKKFPGRNNITGLKTLQHWLQELANEINERLEKDIFENNRRAKQMVVNFVQEINNEEISSSRSAPLHSYDVEVLSKTSLDIIKANTKQFFRAGSEHVLNNPIKFLGISVGKFETISNTQNSIQEMFAQQASLAQKAKAVNNIKQQQSDNDSVTFDTNTQELKKDPQTPFQNKSTLKHNNNEKTGPSVKSFFLKVLKQETQSTNKIICLDKSNSNNKKDDKTLSSDSINLNKKVLFESPQKEQKNSTEFVSKTNTANDKSPNTKTLENNYSNTIIHMESLLPSPLKNKEDIKITNVESPYSIERNNLRNALKAIQNEAIECCNGNIETVNNSTKINLNEKNSTFSSVDIDLNSHNSELNRKRKFLEISTNERQPDYRERYAEFAMPELHPEYLQFINCVQCGTKIFNEPNSIQTHQDLHYAQELSQQQRNEFRSEVQTKINSAKVSPNITNKKSKKDQVLNTTVKKSVNANITKFLRPQEATSTSLQLTSISSQASDCNNPNVNICDICKIPVEMENVAVHKDFHIAKDLQRQLNKLEVHTVTVSKKSASEMSQKSINTSPNTTSRQTKLNVRPITQFFPQSNT